MFGFGKNKKQVTKETVAQKRTNSCGESMDKLDKDGELPFGWVVHNKKYVDMIENDMQPFRQAINDAKTEIEKYAALKSYLIFLEDGKKHYNEINECVGKYFIEYICESMEAEQYEKDFKKVEALLKEQK